jgi:hypothetical protein
VSHASAMDVDCSGQSSGTTIIDVGHNESPSKTPSRTTTTTYMALFIEFIAIVLFFFLSKF